MRIHTTKRILLLGSVIGLLLILCVILVTAHDITTQRQSFTEVQTHEATERGSDAPTPPPELSAFELGEYYFNRGSEGAYDLTKASQHYMQALREDPDGNPYTWYQLGRINFIKGNLASAIFRFDTQIEKFGDEVPEVYYMLGLTYGYLARETEADTDWREAENAFKRYINFAPTAPWPRVDLAWVYFSQGKYEEMLPVLKEGLRHEPDQAWLLNTYGLALMNTGEREEAHAQFRKAKDAAAELTVADWGAAYSGNDPDSWEEGLAEFRDVIDYNIELTEPKRSGIIPW